MYSMIIEEFEMCLYKKEMSKLERFKYLLMIEEFTFS